jgi:hypothetical protein
VEVCRLDDRPAAQVVREFMREYIARHDSAIQGNLFDSDTGPFSAGAQR